MTWPWTPGDIEKLKQAVFNLGTDAAAVLSDSTMVELLETKNRAGDVPTYKEFIDWAGRTTSKVILGHAGASEPTPGRLGGEKMARQIRQDLLEHDARSLQNTLKFQLLWPWVVYQFGKEKACPSLIFHCEAGKNLLSLAQTYGDIVQRLGFRRISLGHIHKRFGIPQPREGEETLADLARQAVANGPKKGVESHSEGPSKPLSGSIQNGLIRSLKQNILKSR